ncbi:glucose-6-phosphate isomerase [Halapricum hydrolyticum]|uniref:Probable glucose-6-phosphate isomerase n=1 Tax=Halapricum hydrolyticum TaxID=2979991 RepID=A0AAE3LIB7_9EURY|nr:glucose-6-phosphate isomerase [Halapricum hydrolyticum]MCU4717181.1 glucose-6-phosphate isomerase [Halapricum hydrolyticum]MCU4726108.1 glucose-6-phosphate isomerase [Halapricum hydrolyticum]
MRVDIGNALDRVATPGVPEDALDRLDDRVADAHARIEEGRAKNEHGYEALNLPETVDTDEIRAAVEPFEDSEYLLNVGIGGSALGAATLSAALDSDVEAYYLDNVDPEWVESILGDVDLSKTAVNVVSRSGTTAETLSNFLVVRDAMESAGVDWTERTWVTTGEEGNLRDLANKHDLPSLKVPDGVPGRFSVLSTVGLAAAALQGHDIDAIVEGAAAAEADLAPSLYESPAYAYGAVAYALDVRGAGINAMMPYEESLETFAEWYAQLWAESLGKDGLGQTPVRALGATDQHSQLQLYRAGPNDKMVTFVRAADREDTPIPETDLEGLSYLGGSSLGELLDAEFEATEASLAAADLPNVRIEIDSVDEYGLGELLYSMEAATVLAGELYDVDTFIQPAVEWGKKAARGLLGGGDFEEADAVADKTTLTIE